ncbi:MAG: acyl-CoA dehydrogenase [Acetobacteraceae bacterium]|nr:acyl-CoA dehydrogenase [Acetobacteraceae bacterium]
MSLPADFLTWLDANAAALDNGTADASMLLPGLIAAGAAEGDVLAAVAAISRISEHSMAAGFVLWGHRVFMEYLIQSPNVALCERLLPDLRAGRVAGATGLSNAMKFLSGLEGLQISAQPVGKNFILNGGMPWVTNLRPQGFHVAAAIAHADGAFVAALPHDAPGLERSLDLDLMAMRATNTAAIRLTDTKLSSEDILHPQATQFLPQVRPAFLGMQCGMSIGLARRALAEARLCAGAARHVLRAPIDDLDETLIAQERALLDGLRAQRFHSAPAKLFEIRIDLAETASQAVALELQASGGRAYLMPAGDGFARRWREAAFVPVITPSLVQLKSALAAQIKQAAA